jgi:hypothetical protein
MRAILHVAAATMLVACGPGTKDEGCADTLLAGDLVVTEVFADFKAPPGGAGADEGKEWFEIYNASDRPLDLKGLTIVHSRPDGSKPNSHVMDAVTIAPGQFLTLGNSTKDLLPAYIDYGYSADLGDLFNTDGGKLTLSCGSSEIDTATYESVKEGHSRELSAAQPPDYTVNNDPASWCQGNDSEFDTGNFGTPGSDNDCVPIVVGQCNDGGTMRDSVAPVAGDLVITEVMPNPAAVSDTVGEWFEAKVIHDVDLNGVGLDRAGDTANPNVIDSPDCIHVAAGSYVVFAKNADGAMNGGLPAGSILGTFTFSLIDGTVAAPGDVRLVAGTTVIDAISWTRSASGKSHQLDPDLIDANSNDMESNFCDGTTPFGLGDLGTPFAANAQCTLLPPPGMCDDGGTLRPIVKPAAGQLVITEFLANPATGTTGSDATREWFEIKNTGAAAFDLNELGVARTGGTPNLVQSASCVSIAAGGFGLFARSNDPAVNGMLPPVDATFSFTLVDSAGNLEVRDGATVLDVITWTSVTSGLSKELKLGQTTATGNDTFPANYCNGSTAYGDMTNKGSPKAANSACP